MSRTKRVRTYDASRRQQRALESQERMLEAARRLFAMRGYAETKIEEIAIAAGVAVPTLYAAFQSKRNLLDALMRRLVAGVPGGPPLLDTAGPRAVAAAADARHALALFVDHLLAVQERVVPLYEVMKHAARTEPEIAELLARLQQYRYSNLASLAARIDELGALRDGLSVEDAARTLWAIASPEVRQMLLTLAGWTVEKYRAWLEDTLDAALLASPGHGVRRR
jgi:AcrR family transcriptional regulator